MSLPELEIKNLSCFFGGIKALTDVSFSVTQKSITAIIGPNGAGKTTLFNLVTGIYSPTAGNIFLNQKKYPAVNPLKLQD